jgi:hypothetical protein
MTPWNWEQEPRSPMISPVGFAIDSSNETSIFSYAKLPSLLPAWQSLFLVMYKNCRPFK